MALLGGAAQIPEHFLLYKEEAAPSRGDGTLPFLAILEPRAVLVGWGNALSEAKAPSSAPWQSQITPAH